MGDVSFIIGDVAQAAGVWVKTVRYYERRGRVAQPGRLLHECEGHGFRKTTVIVCNRCR